MARQRAPLTLTLFRSADCGYAWGVGSRAWRRKGAICGRGDVGGGPDELGVAAARGPVAAEGAGRYHARGDFRPVSVFYSAVFFFSILLRTCG